MLKPDECLDMIFSYGKNFNFGYHETRGSTKFGVRNKGMIDPCSDILTN